MMSVTGTKEPRRENITRDAGHPASQNASSGRDTKLEEDEASPYAQHCRDNAKIWSKYLRETDNEDKEVTSIGNSSLDSMLTFAGLFASVLAAFLIESRKDLAEDPQERLLTELLYALRGTPAPSPVPFQPTTSALAVNTLWFTSLTLTLMSALAGVLAKGWLAQYNPVSRKERMEDAYKRQHRFNMAEIWGLSTVISLIPFGIQVSLFLFFAGLIIQIQDDDLRIRLVVLLLVAIAAILYICWTVSPLFIAEFPFPTPLSRYLRALPWLKKYDWDSSDLLRGLGLLRENVLQVLGQYEPMELQLQILTWGVTSAADEETTDEAIKALSGVKQSSRLREMLYNQEIHNFIRERLQQKFSLSNKSSLTINNTPQIESILLALLRIEKPLHLDGQRNLAISASSNPVMMPPNWEEFRPCLQPLAFSLRIHMLVNASLDDRDELWFQRVDALDRMALNPSTSYVRSILLFAALRGLLQGEKYTRRECGIVFSRLLMTLGSLEEVVGILNSPLETYPNDRGLLDGPELSERIIDLLLCEDTASRCAGARILVVLMSHGKLNSVARRAAENGYIGLFDYSDPDVQLLGIKLFSVLAQDRTMVEYIRNCAPRLVDMFQAERWDVRQAAVIVFGQLSQHGQLARLR
ncbi:hypothetical protein CPB86DRAFT_627638 [Serendipita vermifera]|nr:hypothetical protein CPB86DRAFT_627638 [Serendipita vermifera]